MMCMCGDLATGIWDPTHNLGMCPDLESNPQPFRYMMLQPTEPQPVRARQYFENILLVSLNNVGQNVTL